MSFFPSSSRGSVLSVLGLSAFMGCSSVEIDPFDEQTPTGGRGAEGGGGNTGSTTGSHTTTGGGGDGGGGAGPGPQEPPVLLLAQAGGVAVWKRADEIGSDVLPTATLAGVSNPRKIARHGDDVWVFTLGDTSVAKVLKYADIGSYAGQAATSEVSVDVPTKHGPTTVHDFRVDVEGGMFVGHLPHSQPFLPDMTMLMHWQATGGVFATTEVMPYWRTYAFAVDETVVFAGTSEGIQRFAVNRQTGSMHHLGMLASQFRGYPLVAMFGGDLVAVSACDDAQQGDSCYAPHLRVWKGIGDGSTHPEPDVDITLDFALEPCALDVSATGTFIAMCSGLAGPIAQPPRLLRLAPPSSLDASSVPFGSIQLPTEPRELAVLPADPALDDDPFTVFIRGDDRLLIVRDILGSFVLDEEMVNGISTTYDMLVVD